uniref:Putative secreted protein n=1 Tax=Panstrongylus lignarius TaxID=156445 RepID=A0A224XRG7_9HEMI
MFATFEYSKSLLGLISLLLCNQTTSNLLAPMIRQDNVTGSPSFTTDDSTWLTIRGIKFCPCVLEVPVPLAIGFIVNLHSVLEVPRELVATHV